jgi:hypothetical protein
MGFGLVVRRKLTAKSALPWQSPLPKANAVEISPHRFLAALLFLNATDRS